MTQPPPTEHHDPDKPVRGRAVVIVYTGDGKGKSSAAWGLMVRAVARGWRVAREWRSHGTERARQIDRRRRHRDRDAQGEARLRPRRDGTQGTRLLTWTIPSSPSTTRAAHPGRFSCGAFRRR